MPRASTISDAFNAVAGLPRRDILNHLALQERAVGEIVVSLSVEQPSVSKHLRVLFTAAAPMKTGLREGLGGSGRKKH